MMGCAGLAFIKRGHWTALRAVHSPKHDSKQFVRGVGREVRAIESQRAAILVRLRQVDLRTGWLGLYRAEERTTQRRGGRDPWTFILS